MKVIEKGRDVTHDAQRIRCHRCEAVLEYLNTDIRWGRQGDDDGNGRIDCPECNAVIQVVFK